MHYTVLMHILDVLPKDYHEEFLNRFHQSPHDLFLLSYLEKKTQKNILNSEKKDF